jgi:hypothetical protein
LGRSRNTYPRDFWNSEPSQFFQKSSARVNGKNRRLAISTQFSGNALKPRVETLRTFREM